jgi:serine/threonine protein kinase, bacterial
MSLNSYPILKKIGEGGFGTTYLATNTLMPSQPYCVVKKLIPTATDLQTQQLIQSRFKQEAITLENLGKDSNGTIPSLYAYFVEQGEFYLVQEYVDGINLGERVQAQGLFTEPQVRQLLTDILPILSYVHQRGIVHRDIKPANIMLRNRDNKPILIDFGAVKETMGTMMTPSGHTGKSIVIGTPGFMPVEQMAGRPMFASDIYALGLTIVYLLTGMLPTEFETDPHTGNLKWQSFAANISPHLAAVIDKAIQPVSNYRYQNAQDMLQALANSVPTQAQMGQPATPSKTLVLPAPNEVPTQAYIPPTQQYREPAPSNSQTGTNDRNNPMVATIVGVLIGGGLIVGGLFLGKILGNSNNSANNSNLTPAATDNNSANNSNNNSNNNSPTLPSAPGNNSTSTPTSTPSTTNNSANNPTSAPSKPIDRVPAETPSPTPTNNNETNPTNFTKNDANNLIGQWLDAKRSLFGSSYIKSAGEELTTGLAYERNITASPGTEASSIDELSGNGMYYTYNNQQVHQIVDIVPISADEVRVKAIVSEERTLHNTRTGRTKNSSTVRAKSCYQFKKIGDRWKIYKTPELFDSCP